MSRLRALFRAVMARLRSLLRAGRPLLGLAGGLALVGMSGYVFMLIASSVFAAKSDADRGHLNAVTAFYFLVTTVIMGVYAGLDQTTNRRVAHATAQGASLRPALLRAVRDAVYLTAAVAAGLLALGALLLPKTLHGDLALYSALFAGICAAAAASVVRGVLAGSHRFVAYGLVWAAEGASRIALVAAVLVGGTHSTLAFGYAYVVPFAVSALAGLLLCRRLGLVGAARPAGGPAAGGDGEAASEAADAEAQQEAAQGMGLVPLAVAGLLTTAVGNLPQLVLSSRVTSANLVAVAFGYAFLLARIALTALTPFQSMLLPTFTRLAVNREFAAFRKRLRFGVLVCGGFGALWTLLVVGAGPWLLRDVFHTSPADVPSFAVFLALGGGTILFAVASAVQPALVAVGRYRDVPFIWGAGTVATLAGSFWPGLRPIPAATLAALAGPAAVLVAMGVSARTGAFRGDPVPASADPDLVAAAPRSA